jgi:hypothetical protein
MASWVVVVHDFLFLMQALTVGFHLHEHMQDEKWGDFVLPGHLIIVEFPWVEWLRDTSLSEPQHRVRVSPTGLKNDTPFSTNELIIKMRAFRRRQVTHRAVQTLSLIYYNSVHVSVRYSRRKIMFPKSEVTKNKWFCSQASRRDWLC